MVSVVEICNLALSRIGSKPIQDLSEGTAAANYCKRFYDPCRKAALRAHRWNFALSTATLAQLDESPADYDYAYQLPGGCLRMLRILSQSPGTTASEYRIRGQSLLCNLDSVTVEYLADVTDTNYFDPEFVDALAYRLAADLAVAVANKAELQTSMMRMFQQAFWTARVDDAAESNSARNSDNPYLDARR